MNNFNCVEMARKEAQKILGKIATGIDPVAEKKEKLSRSITLSQAFDDYVKARKALKSTLPKPKIATVAPASTFAVLSTAPIPVVMPQPNKHTLSKGASLLIFATEISGRTVYSEKVDVPI